MNELNELEWKLMNDEALTADEMAALDAALGSTSVSSVVREIENEVPSLQWRSQLNEKLNSLAKPVKRRRTPWLVFAVPATAAMVAGLMLVAQPKSVSGTSNFASKPANEELLLAAHESMIFASDTGTGDGAEPTQKPVNDGVIYWTEDELRSF